MDSARSLMVSINPVNSVRNEVGLESVQVRIEAPPQRQNIWGPSPRHSVQHDHLQIHTEVNPETRMADQIFTHSASLFYPKAHTNHFVEQHVNLSNHEMEQVDSSVRVNQFKANRSVSFENALDTETEAESEEPQSIQRESEDDPILLERSFQDPAFANFVDSQKQKSPEKTKKKGFLSSLFKKSNKRQQPYGDDYIHIERKIDIGDNSESEAESKIHDLMDQSPRFHFLKDNASPKPPKDVNHQVPIVPMPGSPAARQLFSNNHHNMEDEPQIVEHSRTLQEIPKTPQNNYGLQPDERNHETKSSTRVSPEAHIDHNNWEISNCHEEAQPCMDNSLPQQKPTSLDDLIDDFNKRQSVEISSPVSHELPRFIPEHERTQEIDIDAILNLSDTPEETEEELLEEEEQGQFSFTSSTQQTIYQREFSQDQKILESINCQTVDPVPVQKENQTDKYLEEEKRLEMEQTNLVMHNLALEQQLMDQENERIKVANEINDTVQIDERPQSANTSFRERKKPKSMFNFSSFRKPKNKELVNHKPFTEDTYSPNVNQSHNESFQKRDNLEEIQKNTTEDDLATKIVREIQKSTTELSINQTPNHKPAFFNSNNLRKSVRGSNKKRNVKEQQVEETKIKNDDSSNVKVEDILIKEENQDSSFEHKREKKTGFFSLKSFSKDSTHQRRPVSEIETSPASEVHVLPKSKSDSNSFGSLFGSRRSRSQERQMRISSSPKPEEVKTVFGNDPRVQEKVIQENGESSYNEFSSEDIDQVKVNKKDKKGISKGFGMFGSWPKAQPKFNSTDSQMTQPRIIPNTNPHRPTSKPPLPPSKSKSGLTDFFTSQSDHQESPPPSQEIPLQYNKSPISSVEQSQIQSGASTLTSTNLISNSFLEGNNQDSIDISDSKRVSESLNDRKSAFLQSTLQPQTAPETLSDPLPSQTHPPEIQKQISPNQDASLNSSFTEDPVKLRQTGRQSGRFRKSSSGLAESQRISVQRPKTSLSPSTGKIMDSLMVDSMTRPTTPHHHSQTGSSPEVQTLDQRKKSSTISRTESYRRARGTEDDKPEVVKKNDNYKSIPQQQGKGLRRGNSEDSLRNALTREEQFHSIPRSKSRQEKKGECSIM